VLLAEPHHAMTLLVGIFLGISLLALVWGVPLYCLVSGGIDLAHRRGGWGRIAVGVLWIGVIVLGSLASKDGDAPGVLIGVSLLLLCGLVVVPVGLLASGIGAAARREGGGLRIAVGGIWLAALALLVLLSQFFNPLKGLEDPFPDEPHAESERLSRDTRPCSAWRHPATSCNAAQP